MKSKDFAVIPFNHSRIKDRYLVSNILGGWDFLQKDEFRQLSSFSVEKDTPLFKRLHDKGIVIDELNLKNIVDGYRSLNSHLFHDTSLHIAVVTTRCNLHCGYCQAKSQTKQDMDTDVAMHVLECLFGVKTPQITLEFQGGEPLLNWKTIRFLIEQARKLNSCHKDLRLDLVTNATLLDEEKMEFLRDFDVGVCVSLDGPRHIHDKYRIFKNGQGTYALAARNIKKLENKFKKKVCLLSTITKYSFKYFKEIIDEYIKFGQDVIALRPVNRIGNACTNWQHLGYSPEEFIQFYTQAMEYILQLNKKGVFIKERIATVILEKILNKRDPGYVEMMNPCGAGRSQIVYMPDGSCYPCDEARMAGDDIFKLGNILEKKYEDLIKNETLLHLLESSSVELWAADSVLYPWIGTCPVVNYALQNNFVTKIRCSPIYKIYNFQFRYIFEKMLESEENLRIFKSWLIKKEAGHE
jgi:His-Xaa-Ser system radical SAM maturase HxsB